jgi:hypothetical protein
LDHYIELLNRYNQENAYIETTKWQHFLLLIWAKQDKIITQI